LVDWKVDPGSTKMLIQEHTWWNHVHPDGRPVSANK